MGHKHRPCFKLDLQVVKSGPRNSQRKTKLERHLRKGLQQLPLVLTFRLWPYKIQALTLRYLQSEASLCPASQPCTQQSCSNGAVTFFSEWKLHPSEAGTVTL